MKRLSSWPEKLSAHIDACRARTFEWGRFDCGLFVADAILAMTGEDPAADFRGYTDAKGAYKTLIDCGVSRRTTTPPGIESVLEVLAAKFQWREVAVPYAQRGDPLLLEASEPGALEGIAGLCIGPMAAAAGEGGLVFFSMKTPPNGPVLRAWHFD